MKDIHREKYANLMTQIEILEERVSDMEEAIDPDDKAAEQELVDLRDELSKKRSELARISDGCGNPHAMQ